MLVYALYPETIDFGTALFIAFAAILIVFLILIIIVFVSGGASIIVRKTEARNNINPRPENALLEKDEDAVVASIVATIEFNKEFNTDARLVKIERIN